MICRLSHSKSLLLQVALRVGGRTIFLGMIIPEPGASNQVVEVLVPPSCLTLCDPWTVARQAPLSMELPRQEYWNGLPFPSPGDLPNPGIKPRFPALQADSLPSELPGKPRQSEAPPITQSLSILFRLPSPKLCLALPQKAQ